MSSGKALGWIAIFGLSSVLDGGAIARAGGGPADAASLHCWKAHGFIQVSFDPTDCDSVVGMCTRGEIAGASGFLNGTTRFRATGLGGAVVGEASIVTPPAEPATTWSYSGELVLTTHLGTLTFSDVGIFDTFGGTFSEIDRVTDASGIFEDASGTLFMFGQAYADGSGFEGDVRGTLCVPSRAPHGGRR